MGITTPIEWCDSTVNPQEGCDGCELWHPTEGGTCYAGDMITRWGKGGKSAHPSNFGEPEIYPYRLAQAVAWPDLTGTDRPDKPWLNGYPRTVFVDDMGDTFTKSLDDPDYLRRQVESALAAGKPNPEMYLKALGCVEDGGHWLEPFVPMMAEAPHIWQILTKRPNRMRRFFERIGEVPQNFWLMTSVTSHKTLSRVRQLLSIDGASLYGVSYEPIRGDVDFRDFTYRIRCSKCNWSGAMTSRGRCQKCKSRKHVNFDGPGVSWIIPGGESGAKAEPCSVASVRSVIEQADDSGATVFVKQLGRRASMSATDAIQAGFSGSRISHNDAGVVITFKNPKGGDMSEWPPDIRRREMPRSQCQ